MFRYLSLLGLTATLIAVAKVDARSSAPSHAGGGGSAMKSGPASNHAGPVGNTKANPTKSNSGGAKKLPGNTGNTKKGPDTAKLPNGKKGADPKTPTPKKTDTTKNDHPKNDHPKNDHPKHDQHPKTDPNGKRPNQYPNYHHQYGKAFAGGFYYPGAYHRHWTHSIWDSRYGCHCYWDPCCNSYYYYCQPDTCYYPVSYCPYQTYCWTPPACPTCTPAPVDTSVPCTNCPPPTAQANARPTPTPEPPTSAPATDADYSAIPAVPAPLVARGDV